MWNGFSIFLQSPGRNFSLSAIWHFTSEPSWSPNKDMSRTNVRTTWPPRTDSLFPPPVNVVSPPTDWSNHDSPHSTPATEKNQHKITGNRNRKRRGYSQFSQQIWWKKWEKLEKTWFFGNFRKFRKKVGRSEKKTRVSLRRFSEIFLKN